MELQLSVAREQRLHLDLARQQKFSCHCEHILVVKPQPSKLMMRVRFPPPASCSRARMLASLLGFFLG
jgi:hypothetical protein